MWTKFKLIRPDSLWAAESREHRKYLIWKILKIGALDSEAQQKWDMVEIRDNLNGGRLKQGPSNGAEKAVPGSRVIVHDLVSRWVHNRLLGCVSNVTSSGRVKVVLDGWSTALSLQSENISRMCSHCDASNKCDLRACARYKSAFYCSREHQILDYKQHKAKCGKEKEGSSDGHVYRIRERQAAETNKINTAGELVSTSKKPSVSDSMSDTEPKLTTRTGFESAMEEQKIQASKLRADLDEWRPLRALTALEQEERDKMCQGQAQELSSLDEAGQIAFLDATIASFADSMAQARCAGTSKDYEINMAVF